MAQESPAPGGGEPFSPAEMPAGSSLLNHFPEPVLVVELDSYRVLHWNRAAEVAYGVPTPEVPTCYALSHGRDSPCKAPDEPCPLQELEAEGHSPAVEHLHLDRQGRPRYFRVQASPIRDELGSARWVLETHVDISDQKAEQALLARLFQAGEPAAITDPAGRVHRANQACCDLLGMPEEALRGRPLVALAGRIANGATFRSLWRSLRRNGQAQGELEVVPEDGEVRTWWVSLTAVADEAGRPDGYVVQVSDLTERRARERTLRRYRAAFEQSRDAVLFLDDQQFLEGNRAALEMFRVPSAQVLRALQPADLSPGRQPDGSSSRQGIADRLRQAFTRGQAFFRWQHQTLAGGAFPAEVLLSRIGLEEGAVLQAVVRDVTEQEARFEEIRRARNRAQQYFEVARVMMVVLAPDGRVRAINRRGCELLGMSRQEVIGTDWFERFLPAEIRGEMGEVFTGIMRGAGQLEDYAENEVLVGEGERRLFAFWNTVLRDGEGAVEGVLSSGEDITEKRRHERQLRWQAQRDDLLGIYNRRAFEEFLEREMSRVGRQAGRLSLVMFDIDHFKAVNDTYGHLLGDDILKELAEVAASRLRREDVLARWGGEEFIVLLPDTGSEGAHRVAEGLRQAVAEADFPGPGRLAVSVGVAEMRPGEELKDLTRRVDEALYVAKAAGRDRVRVAGQSPDPQAPRQPAT